MWSYDGRSTGHVVRIGGVGPRRGLSPPIPDHPGPMIAGERSVKVPSIFDPVPGSTCRMITPFWRKAGRIETGSACMSQRLC